MKRNFSTPPKCTNCGEIFNSKRYNLGYQTCLECGGGKKSYTVAPAYNKGAYQLINRKDISDIGK